MKLIDRVISGLSMVLVAVMLQACLSDGNVGDRRAAEESPSVSATKINSFKVRPAAATKAEAKSSVEIESGDSIILSWDVAGAKTVAIQSTAHNDLLKGKAFGLSGEQRLDNITQNDSFVLIIKGGKDGEEDQQSVTVTIRKKEPASIVSFEATPSTVRSGAASELCFQLSDKEAKAKIMVGKDQIWPVDAAESTEEEVTEEVVEDDAVSVQKSLMLGKVATPSAPQDPYAGSEEEGTEEEESTDAPTCVAVTPSVTTTYVLSVVSEDGSEGASKEVTVTVEESDIAIVFSAQPTQLGAAGDVILTWRVTPEDVQVSIEPAVVTNVTGSGEVTVKVSATTTFKLTAVTKGGKSKTAEATVLVGGGSGTAVRLIAVTPSVFAGEAAVFAVTSGETSPSTVTVLDPAGNASEAAVSNGRLTVSNPVSGAYMVEANGARSNAVSVEVRHISTKNVGAWNSVVVRSNDVVVGAGQSNSDVQIGAQKVNVGNEFAKSMGLHADWMSKFAPYRVNALVADQKGRLYAAVTSGVFYSNDSGVSWKLLDPMPLYDNAGKYKSKEEAHTGCFGSTRKGTKNLGGEGAKNPLVNVVEVCDITVLPGTDGVDRLIVATDFGAFFYADVDARIKSANKSNGIQGGTKENVLFGKAVNKIAVAKSGDTTILIAGASDGVYINDQSGDPKAWQQLNKEGLSGAVNAVAVSGSTIFAGTDGGLFKYEGLTDGGKWSPVVVEYSRDTLSVKALAVDAANPSTVYVGTKEGLMVARGCAKSFTVVPTDMGEVRNIATSSDGVQSTVAVAGSKGLFVSTGLAAKGDACSKVAAVQKPAEKPASETAPLRPTNTSEPIVTGPGTVTPK